MEISKVGKILFAMNVTRTLCQHKIRYLSPVLSRSLENSHFDLRQRSEWVKLFWQACLRHHIFATLVKFNLNLGNLKSQLQTETLYFLCLHVLVYKMNLDLSKSSSQLAEFRNVPSRTIIRCEESKPSNYSLFSFLHCHSSWT